LCYKQKDITDVVTWTIDTTSTAAGGTTTATVPANVVTSSQAGAATTNPGVSVCYNFDTISFVCCSENTRPLVAT